MPRRQIVCSSVVPLANKQALGLGDKLGPSNKLPSYCAFYRSYDFRIQFMRRSCLIMKDNTRVDPLNGLRRRFYKHKSEWVPKKQDIHESVCKFLDSVSDDAVVKFHGLKQSEKDAPRRMPNISLAQQWGFKWVRLNSN